MADLLLVSAGENIRFWEVEGYVPVQQFNPHAGNVSCVRWSHDNTVLASASTCGDKIALTYTNSAAYSHEIAVGEKRTCLAFNSTSRYIMGGGPDGIIHVWDLKTQKRKNSYKDHKSKITSLQFNWNDTVIASGADNGDIIVYNVVTAVGSSPMRTPKTQAICELQYSHFKKSLLASASDDGTVNLWDTNTRRLLHSFTDMHKAPVTGIAFSPLNEMLLMSVGLDKRIVCYDVQGKVAVKTMMAESPLTSIDLSHDGATLAVGSSRGKIYIYDLRKGATPVRVMSDHKSSVQGLHFQCQVKSAKSDVAGGTLRATTPTSTKRSTSTSATTNKNNAANLAATSNGVAHHRAHTAPENRGLTDRTNLTPSSAARLDNKSSGRIQGRDSGHLTQDFEAEIFSPIREPTTGYSHRSDDAALLSENRPESPRLLANHSHPEAFADGVFSPLADGLNLPSERSRPVGSSTGYSPQPSDAELQNRSRPARRHSSGEPHAGANFDSHSPMQRQQLPHGEDSAQSQGSSLSSSRGDVTSGEDVPNLSDAVSEQIRTRQFETRPRSQMSYGDFPIIKVSSPGSLPMTSSHTYHQSYSQSHPVITPPDATPSGGGTAAAAAAAGPHSVTASAQPFQTQFIKNLINESLDDFREQVRQDVLNLHMEMLKQFQIQQQQTKLLLEQYSVNGELLAEIERLREENAKLRKTF